MKTLQCGLIIVIVLVTAMPIVYADSPDKAESGFSGSLQIGGLYFQTDSQLYTADSNTRTHKRNGPADTYDETLPMGMIHLQYQRQSGTVFYVGNPLELEAAMGIQAGVKQPLVVGALDLAVSWVPGKQVWKNPYLVGTEREKSNADVFGLKLALEEIGGTHWEAAYKIDRTDIEDDAIGDLTNDLKRSGWTHELTVQYNLPVHRGLSFHPQLQCTYADIEGRSNTYRGIGVGAKLQQVFPYWIVAGHVSGYYNQYDETHPLYEKTRQESELNLFAKGVRLNLFGHRRLFASVIAGAIWSDANIDFFDSTTMVCMASIGIKF